MAVSVTIPYAGPYYPNGVTTAFPFAFKAMSGDELVLLDDQGDEISGFSFSTTLDANEGGTITFATPPASADLPTFVIASSPVFGRPNDFGQVTAFNPRSLNDPLDRLSVQNIFLKDRLQRVPRVPYGSTGLDGQFPVVLPGGGFGWSNGTGADAGMRTDLASPATGKGAALIAYSPAVTAAPGTLPAVLQQKIDPRDFGAPGDGSNAMTALTGARARALTLGVPLDGGGKTYGVIGTIEMENDEWLQNITFKQLDPGSSLNVITLLSNSKNNVTWINVKVDRNGDGTNGGHADDNPNGGLNSAFGIKVNGGTGHHFRDLEVFGDDTGIGIYMYGLDQTSYVSGLYAHDMNGVQTAGDGTDEAAIGINLIACTGVTFERVRSVNMSMTYGATTKYWGTRGVSVGGMQRCTFVAPEIDGCGEGFDMSSSLAQADCVILGGSISNCYTWGVKLAHDVRRWLIKGVRAYRCGDAGFADQTDAGVAAPGLLDENVFEDCVDVDTGYYTGYVVNKYGQGSDSGSATYPIGASFRNCRSITTSGGPAKDFCFANQKAASATCLVGFPGCDGNGASTATFAGEHLDYCRLMLASDQSISNATVTAVAFGSGTEISNTGFMHDVSVNNSRVTIRNAGVYQIACKAGWAANAAGSRVVYVYLNGVEVDQSITVPPGAAAFSAPELIYTSARLKAGDYLEMFVRQSSGGSLALVAANSSSQVIVRRVAV